jgi:hypothetical protein
MIYMEPSEGYHRNYHPPRTAEGIESLDRLALSICLKQFSGSMLRRVVAKTS